jgi:hypothetical protein
LNSSSNNNNGGNGNNNEQLQEQQKQQQQQPQQHKAVYPYSMKIASLAKISDPIIRLDHYIIVDKKS